MTPYFLMLGFPGLLAMVDERRRFRALLPIVAVLYCAMIGLRYRVGTDWANYLRLFERGSDKSLVETVFSREPGFALLNWFAYQTGGGYILLNAIAAVIFCWGFFYLAKSCREPFLAIVVATPLVVIAVSMNVTRQAIAFGFIAYLYATWDKGGFVRKTAWVLFASLFHFSAIFVLTFVALSARTSGPVKVFAGMVTGGIIFAFIAIAPSAMEAYSQLYVRGPLEAPGAIFHVAVLETAAVAFLLFRRKWALVYGDNPLCLHLALVALTLVPAVAITSVGAYRLSIYFWPMAMYVWSGMPGIVETSLGRSALRLSLVMASAVVLFVWLNYANNGADWLPYHNWLLAPVNAPM